jgi:predicted nucleic acid-binding protein
MVILANCDSGKWELLTSKVLEYEFNNDKDEERRQYMIALYCDDEKAYPISDEVNNRAKEFQKCGVKLFDSIHLATAEYAEADVLITVDDQFVSSAKRTDSKIKVTNPIKFMEGL